MANFIIKPKNDDHLKLQNDAGTDIVEIKNDDATLYVSSTFSAPTGEITKDNANAELVIAAHHSTDGTTPKLTMRKADGSGASPTVVANNDVLGTISFEGNDGGAGAWEEGARIEARVDGTPGANDMPTELTFWTTKDGSATAVEQMVLGRQGNLKVRGGFAHSFLTASLINGY